MENLRCKMASNLFLGQQEETMKSNVNPFTVAFKLAAAFGCSFECSEKMVANVRVR